MMNQPISELVDAHAATVTQVDQPVPAPRPALFAWLLRPTGPGPIEQYRDHPLCPGRSEAWAHILRGLSGLTGVDAGLALVDIAVGLTKLLRPAAPDQESPA